MEGKLPAAAPCLGSPGTRRGLPAPVCSGCSSPRRGWRGTSRTRRGKTPSGPPAVGAVDDTGLQQAAEVSVCCWKRLAHAHGAKSATECSLYRPRWGQILGTPASSPGTQGVRRTPQRGAASCCACRPPARRVKQSRSLSADFRCGLESPRLRHSRVSIADTAATHSCVKEGPTEAPSGLLVASIRTRTESTSRASAGERRSREAATKASSSSSDAAFFSLNLWVRLFPSSSCGGHGSLSLKP